MRGAFPALTRFPQWPSLFCACKDSDDFIHQMSTSLLQPQLSLEDNRKKKKKGANIKKNYVRLQMRDALNGSAGAAKGENRPPSAPV